MARQRSWPSGPGELLDLLTAWVARTPWVDWLELGGSLGRGAGDEHSDVDAGVGVTGEDRLDAVAAAVGSFAPVAAVLREPFGSGSTHLLTVYRDGRQLSLVVMAAEARTGLPPQSLALLDRSGRLSTSLDPARWEPDADRLREWTFLACVGAADALKHARRGSVWRAVRCLEEARGLYLQLVAAQQQVVFAGFGVVSLENAGRPVPAGLAATLVDAPRPAAVADAVAALVALLQPFVTEHGLDGLGTALGLRGGA
ncbi:hypothetical protein GC722_11050 [Auraticoccus sp. F435]|uniref:Nucleotidyltransferase domain-containing protein n=1 Tax=Auraticoccus cholistanensis TaxID=2656650 RepID=A0A6A9UV51_9ACTN|nr:hypothetical protein [Auraticoccus cholistanensis]MVA76558.1 hypothetical protein [Auraticoccus cholistanensis]